MKSITNQTTHNLDVFFDQLPFTKENYNIDILTMTKADFINLYVSFTKMSISDPESFLADLISVDFIEMIDNFIVVDLEVLGCRS